MTEISTSPRPRHLRTIAVTATAVTLAATAVGLPGAWAMSTAIGPPATATAVSPSRQPEPGTHHGSNWGWSGGMRNGSNGWSGGMHNGWSGGMHNGSNGWSGQMGAMGGMGSGGWSPTNCTAPPASGTQVRYVSMDMGSMMRLMPMWTRVASGTVTIDLINRGTMPHEVLIYPLAPGEVAGQRTVGGNDRVDEAGVLGEVEPVCDQSVTVDGIAAGNLGRVTLRLQPGRYEIVCNLPGHYSSGMFETIVVQSQGS